MRFNSFKKFFKKKDVQKASDRVPVGENVIADQTVNSVAETSSGGKRPIGITRSVLMGFYTSEKSTYLSGYNQYIFRVVRGANKIEIAKEVVRRYDVKVKAVRVANVRGKRRDVGRHPGMRPGWRKATVTLQPGYSIGQVKSI